MAFSDNNGQGTPILKLLRKVIAGSSSDIGHKGFLWDWVANKPDLRLDYGHCGAPVSTVTTQAITKSYNNMQDKIYRYHIGCSRGRRIGNMSLFHDPEHYDSVVASTVVRAGDSHRYRLGFNGSFVDLFNLLTSLGDFRNGAT